jgi:hypothetical protein
MTDRSETSGIESVDYGVRGRVFPLVLPFGYAKLQGELGRSRWASRSLILDPIFINYPFWSEYVEAEAPA